MAQLTHVVVRVVVVVSKAQMQPNPSSRACDGHSTAIPIKSLHPQTLEELGLLETFNFIPQGRVPLLVLAAFKVYLLLVLCIPEEMFGSLSTNHYELLRFATFLHVVRRNHCFVLSNTSNLEAHSTYGDDSWRKCDSSRRGLGNPS